MRKNSWQLLGRVLVALFIMASGSVLVANADRSEEPLDWRAFASAYDPNLDVNHNDGASGSIFAFTGVGYPANSVATVYVNGNEIGHVLTNSNGVLAFMMDSAGAPQARYFITAAVDNNASDTKDFDVDNGEPMWPAPPGFPGPTFPVMGNPNLVADMTYQFAMGNGSGGSGIYYFYANGTFMDHDGNGGVWGFTQNPSRLRLIYDDGSNCNAFSFGSFTGGAGVSGYRACTDGSGVRGVWNGTILLSPAAGWPTGNGELGE